MESSAVRIEFLQIEETKLEAQYDLETQFSELVDGAMHTEFDLLFDGIDLYGPDGRGLDEVTQKGLDHAKKYVRQNPDMWFNVRRSRIEREERTELIEMARGYGPNTMIVVSDYPEELMHATKDIGGYNVTRKQTMLRVFNRHPNGKIKMHSLSLDGSNRKALEEIYRKFGKETETGELLGQRIRSELSEGDQLQLVGDLRQTYDQSLTKQFGGKWFAGRKTADIRNTYDFVCRQRDLIEACVRLQHAGELSDTIMYNAAATMQKRFEHEEINSQILRSQLSQLDPNILIRELERNGENARYLGKSFSACGATLIAEGFTKEFGLKEAGYGDDDSDEDTECTFISKKCPHCTATNVRTTVTKTHVFGSCGCRVRKSKK